ncbi:hypothetical protein [Frigoriglobus tundricola]|uniref:Deoxyhypusine synthase n=1 Tax=Frigoriglobus tundricola TaxID=2774151 RepID=A0A6M5Z2N7_9BACT|nr:hypothetical protein [Frigoriglobus tundricola]QJX00680.1 hypothetical protein FTUN_8312 [Frigoriglobus tundricola]
MTVKPLDFGRLHVLPLAHRTSLTRADDILIDPDVEPKPCSERNAALVAACAERIRAARTRGAAVMLIYGAHLLRNGTARLLERMMAAGWLTHLATNGAGTIHDWEYAWLGASTESVELGVAGGQFGTWDETATNIHLALMAGALDGLGYGRALGRFIAEDGALLPHPDELRHRIATDPDDPLTAARADLLRAMREQGWRPGRVALEHRWKHASILAQAWRHGVPVTVHPGIGYDIISNHSVFSGSALGRAGEWDFKLFGGSVENLDGGVVLSVGSAIMGPQVFEKSISCVNNIRRRDDRGVVTGHSIFVVDLQDGGNWDWTTGEPPKTNPAYYLRFCKSYSRMGGAMHYLQCDNAAFVHHLYRDLSRQPGAG